MLPSTAAAFRKGATMRLHSPQANQMNRLAVVFFLCVIGLRLASAQAGSQANPLKSKSEECRVEAVDYKGWHAQQISNRWVQLVVVPQNGGRLIQVSFAGHPYLFNNPKYLGKYLPPDG